MKISQNLQENRYTIFLDSANEIGYELVNNGIIVNCMYNSLSKFFDQEKFKNSLRMCYKDINVESINVVANIMSLYKEDISFIISLLSKIGVKKINFISKKNLGLDKLPTIRQGDVFFGKRVVIIDLHNFFHRYYHALPEKIEDGNVVTIKNAFKHYLKDLGYFEYIVFASEGEKNIRTLIYSEYKRNRSEKDASLLKQIKETEDWIQSLGYKVSKVNGYEADDIIGAFVEKFRGAKIEIHSTDKDLYQLLEPGVKIYNPMKKVFITSDDCIKKFHVSPEKVVYSLALSGDSSDNVPGIKGIGIKKAASILNNDFIIIDKSNEFAPFMSLYENIDKFKGALKENLIEGRSDLIMSYKLVKLYTYIIKDFHSLDYKYTQSFS